MADSKYINRGGDIVYPTPFAAEGVQFWGYGVKADIRKMQSVLDEALNAPLGQALRFVPAASQVLFVFNAIAALYSTAPEFRNRGRFPEHEGAVWMLVCDTQEERLFFYHPYMLVDNPYAMAMGREIYGFPKSLGEFTPMGADGTPAPASIAVSTWVVEKFGPTAEGSIKPLITATQLPGSSLTPAAVFNDLADFVREICRLLKLEPNWFKELELAAHCLEDLLAMNIPFVFLKQFRDGPQSETACFQAIQESNVHMAKFYGAKIYAEPYQITVGDFDSHPIIADLGLASAAVSSELSFWAKFDFEIGAATLVKGAAS